MTPLPKLRRTRFLGVPFDIGELDEYVSFVASWSPKSPFGYVATPNVDHVIRINESPVKYASLYDHATLSINDSRILRLCSRLRGKTLPVFSGIDLVAAIFDRVIQAGDVITVIGADSLVVRRIRQRFPHVKVWHHIPPMGFIRDPAEVDAAAEFVAAHKARFVFLAIGSPQQEILASRIMAMGSAVGLGLCIGAALLFLTGAERRAPLWLRRLNLEWAFRLYKDPKRLWRRYLVRGPLIIRLLVIDMLGRGKERGF